MQDLNKAGLQDTQLQSQRELQSGAGDAFAVAFEMVATPVVFAAGGWFIDTRLGVFPICTLVLVIGVFIYQMWRAYHNYTRQAAKDLDERRSGYTPYVSGRHEDSEHMKNLLEGARIEGEKIV